MYMMCKIVLHMCAVQLFYFICVLIIFLARLYILDSLFASQCFTCFYIVYVLHVFH